MLFLIAYYIVLIGFRDVTVGADTIVYLSSPTDLTEMFNGKDGLFLILHRVFFTIGGEEFLLVLFTILLFTLIVANSILLSPKDIIVPFTCFLISMSFVAFSVNILRQGLSIYCFTLFYSLCKNKKIAFALVFLFLSIALHRYTAILVLVFLLSNVVKNDNYLIMLILLVIGIAIGFENVKKYIELNDIYNFTYEDWILDEFNISLGINWLMVAFNGIFILQMLVIYSLNKATSIRELISPIFYSFVFLTIAFIVAMSFPYSDRIGQLGWCLIPLFLIFLSTHTKGPQKIFKKLLVFDLFLLCNIQFYFLFFKQ